MAKGAGAADAADPGGWNGGAEGAGEEGGAGIFRVKKRRVTLAPAQVSKVLVTFAPPAACCAVALRARLVLRVAEDRGVHYAIPLLGKLVDSPGLALRQPPPAKADSASKQAVAAKAAPPGERGPGAAGHDRGERAQHRDALAGKARQGARGQLRSSPPPGGPVQGGAPGVPAGLKLDRMSVSADSLPRHPAPALSRLQPDGLVGGVAGAGDGSHVDEAGAQAGAVWSGSTLCRQRQGQAPSRRADRQGHASTQGQASAAVSRAPAAWPRDACVPPVGVARFTEKGTPEELAMMDRPAAGAGRKTRSRGARI